MKNDAFRFLTIANSNDFETEALATFHRQHKANPVYRSYCDLINISPSEVKTSTKIPLYPFSFSNRMPSSVLAKRHQLFLALVEQPPLSMHNIPF